MHDAHVAMITDWDSDGLLMSLKVYDDVSKDIFRIGIDWETRDELKQMYPEHSGDLELDKVQEEYKPGNSYKKLKSHAYWGKEERRIFYHNLWRLERWRIEIDSVQRAIGYQKLWVYIIKKLGERFPERNYNRAVQLPRTILPDIYLQLGDLLNEIMKPELDILKQEIRRSLENFNGFLDNVNDSEEAIEKYFKQELNNSKSGSLIDILNKIKVLMDQSK
jgi:hypothetical protein